MRTNNDLLAVVASYDSLDVEATSLRQADNESDFMQLSQLFTGSNAVSGPDQIITDSDWSASVQLVCDVAARVKLMHQRLQAITQDARDAAYAATLAASAAEDRAQTAETVAIAAVTRAELAEEQLRALAQKFHQAEERANISEKNAKESLYWLKRMHDCISSEFIELTID